MQWTVDRVTGNDVVHLRAFRDRDGNGDGSVGLHLNHFIWSYHDSVGGLAVVLGVRVATVIAHRHLFPVAPVVTLCVAGAVLHVAFAFAFPGHSHDGDEARVVLLGVSFCGVDGLLGTFDALLGSGDRRALVADGSGRLGLRVIRTRVCSGVSLERFRTRAEWQCAVRGRRRNGSSCSRQGNCRHKKTFHLGSLNRGRRDHRRTRYGLNLDICQRLADACLSRACFGSLNL